jgi:hypothetical protein
MYLFETFMGFTSMNHCNIRPEYHQRDKNLSKFTSDASKLVSYDVLMHQMRISTNYISSMMVRPKNLELQNVMIVKTENNAKHSGVKCNQICQRIELCMKEI